MSLGPMKRNNGSHENFEILQLQKEVAQLRTALDDQIGQWIKAKDEANVLRADRDGLETMLRTINGRVIPGEMDTTESYRAIVAEWRLLRECFGPAGMKSVAMLIEEREVAKGRLTKAEMATKPLLEAVDTAVWAWNRRTDKRIDWKGAVQDLAEAYGLFKLAADAKGNA